MVASAWETVGLDSPDRRARSAREHGPASRIWPSRSCSFSARMSRGRAAARGPARPAGAVATDAAAGARACFDRGIRSARELLAAFAPGRELAAVGVATFGIPFDDHVDLAPNVGGWGDLPLGHELRAAFPGAAVRMATDAKAAALAESRWGALAGADP